MDTTFKFRLGDETLYLRKAVTSTKEPKIRARPVWLHLITIFFTKKMFYHAVKYGIAGGIMFHYHTRLGFCLFVLSAFADYA